MIVGIEAFFRKFLRRFNRSEWMIRLLNLTFAEEPASRPGLVIIQIDGLGFTQFERAMRKGNLPFLARLTREEGYSSHRHYTGLPSNTPAVQGALFYGVKGCVPAFSFKDSQTGQVFNMFTPQSASAVENRLKEKGKPLLAGGSAYGNIFTGGAKEAHFCGASMGWGSLLKAANPLGPPLTLLLNLHIFVRASFLVVLELILALGDSFRGILSGKNLVSEIRFIPLRVTICILLREIIAAGAKIDIARGLPVIHVNFAGYDEQAHHRGPASGVSHWSLKGIDHAIKGIWIAAKRAQRRDYDVFIYSDHGQEETAGYSGENGRSIQEAVDQVFEEKIAAGSWQTEFSHGVPYWRADLLRDKPGKRMQAAYASTETQKENAARAVVTAMGPVGHIYPPQPFSSEEKESVARKFVVSAKIPLVMTPAGPGKAFAWTSSGKFTLPEEADKVMEAEHPFYEEVVRDLVEMCHHPDAGEFIIFGWRPGPRSLTFPHEHGSHAGPGIEETSGFALLPVDALDPAIGNTIRTHELREAAFRALGRSEEGPFFRAQHERLPLALRFMTYNVHSCMGRDGKISLHRIARIIARHDPDIVALQELGTNENAHQAEIIAQKLAMSFHFHPSLSVKKGQRGNAILSKFPMRLVRDGSLPKLPRTPFLEPRAALWTEIDAHGLKVQVFNTHLSLSSLEGLLQMKALCGPDWMGSPACQGPVVLCGDFNALSNSKICKQLSQVLKNTHFESRGRRSLKTLPSWCPLTLVDHIFVGHGLKMTHIEVPKTGLEKMASDHLPLIVDVQVG